MSDDESSQSTDNEFITQLADEIKNDEDETKIQSKKDIKKAATKTKSLEMLEQFAEHAGMKKITNNDGWDSDIYDAAVFSKWVYGENSDNSNIKMYKPVINTTVLNTVQFGIANDAKGGNRLFLAFRGTSVSGIEDIMADVSALPTPVYPPVYLKGSNQTRSEIYLHSGAYCEIVRCYEYIWKKLIARISQDNINKIIICGHSLGGGLATTFGLLSIIGDRFTSNNVTFKIITFAGLTPVLLSKPLSNESKQFIKELNDNTTNIVNKYDIVPRILAHKIWWYFILDLGLTHIAKKIPGFKLLTKILTRRKGNDDEIKDAGGDPTDDADAAFSDALHWDYNRLQALQKSLMQKYGDSMEGFMRAVVHVCELTPLITSYNFVGKYYFYFGGNYVAAFNDDKTIRKMLTFLMFDVAFSEYNIKDILGSHSMDHYLSLSEILNTQTHIE